MGLTSRDGIIPLYLRNDVGGPMARTVEDAARVLDVIAGPDPADPDHRARTRKDPEKLPGLPRPERPEGGPRSACSGPIIDAPRGDPRIKALVEKAIADMKADGAVIVDPFAIPDFEALTKNLWCDMFKRDVEAYLATLGPRAPFRTLSDIVASGQVRRGERAAAAAGAGGRPRRRPPVSISTTIRGTSSSATPS